ncbi:hypothetical protein HMPREF9711_00756 [Myroides odoratimimus CCUG 3837]|nr:hypothetical protein HMPREF9711_00756 [Myroides odoratimimus CCUG 3837]
MNYDYIPHKKKAVSNNDTAFFNCFSSGFANKVQ